MLIQLHIFLMHHLKTTLKYLEEVDTLDEVEVDTLKLKNGIAQLKSKHNSFKNSWLGVHKGLSAIEYNNVLVTGRNLI